MGLSVSNWPLLAFVSVFTLSVSLTNTRYGVCMHLQAHIPTHATFPSNPHPSSLWNTLQIGFASSINFQVEVRLWGHRGLQSQPCSLTSKKNRHNHGSEFVQALSVCPIVNGVQSKLWELEAAFKTFLTSPESIFIFNSVLKKTTTYLPSQQTFNFLDCMQKGYCCNQLKGIVRTSLTVTCLCWLSSLQYTYKFVSGQNMSAAQSETLRYRMLALNATSDR